MSSASMFTSSSRVHDPSNAKVRIGVLALQGAFIEHINILNSFDDVFSFPVKTAADCENIDGLVLPGGESTTMGKLITIDPDLREKLESLVVKGVPMWGTCAGGKFPDPYLLRAMDIDVTRNYFGPQTMSFTTAIRPTDLMRFHNTKRLEAFDATFIRAPIASSINSEDVHVLGTIVHEEKEVVVAVEQGPFLGTSFHPELTMDDSWHKWWVNERVIPMKNTEA
ncbi:glutamine aminotransferase subunit [Schizosaccharomyces cryophilus OY26]|uniref:glutaminase n=1 Tax=Schizosaccharomyces cryophilus (strain OY26 / ATCC MYA-4695 / CBS 11777 / NBRC 106824 / NRRL Y48691) TaxID=653667 RepID=S9VS53_SCHCR|nr:glutamine aminotransferase subunit [Schizosaccharomyces cryophilus OY26]EPY50758.1 glutamine aminotransferase subunit [Schizosaccharomyces cryophilus OY26]